MNLPTPAIVAQGAVRRLPRVALWLFCLSYVLPGFIGREPWKSADMTAFGYMAALAGGQTDWFAPHLSGLAPTVDALLPYWLGAWAIQIAPAWIAPEFAARTPFMVMLAISLIATWYGTYYLARRPAAQPVAFAFGGEALAPDYARAVADGGLLAFIACLGLAQLSHEVTPAVAQLCFTALGFYAISALSFRRLAPTLAGIVALLGLALSGAPSLAVILGLGGALVNWLDQTQEGQDPLNQGSKRSSFAAEIFILALVIAVAVGMLGLWRWRIALPDLNWNEWQGIGRLLVWFTWPAWPLVLLTLWHWRRQLRPIFSGRVQSHLTVPLMFLAITLVSTLVTSGGDRALLLALPAMAALAAFALPTLGRSFSALIDWFTLLFFTGCAICIWVVWIALQTGIPPQPAMNVERLAPGFVHSFSYTPFLLALAATLAWGWLVKWRIGRHPTAIWKSLVLPAGGAALSWLLLMTLWLPLLDYARGYTTLAQSIVKVIKKPDCVETHGLDRGQIAAFQHYGGFSLKAAQKQANCLWLLVDRDATQTLGEVVTPSQWTPQFIGYRPTDRDDDVLLYRRTQP